MNATGGNMWTKRLRRGLWIAVALAAGGYGWLYFSGTSPKPEDLIANVKVQELGGPFELTDQHGHGVSEADVAGKPYAVFFGFTNCPDVCPTTLFTLSEQLKELGPAADRLKVLFVSVDPERDTREQLELYMTSFDPRISALTGTPQNIDRMIKNFRAYYRKVPTEGGYTMDHTAVVYLMGADGKFISTLDTHEDPKMQLGKLKRLLDS